MWRALADAAADLVLGAACPGCGVPAARLCPACAREVAAASPVLVPGQAGGATSRPPVGASARYVGVWQPLIVHYKEHGGWWLAGPLAGALAQAVAVALAAAGAGAGPVLLVPMPSRPQAVRQRGQDTTRLLAARAAGLLRRAGLDAAVSDELRYARGVADQSGLGVAGRRRNLDHAFVAHPRGAGTRVVVDDLVTTGASLAEACRALADAGRAASACAVVAATPRHHPSRRST